MKVKLKLEIIIGYIFGERPTKLTDQNVCPHPRHQDTKTPKISVMTCGSIGFHGVGTLCFVDGTINANKHIDILYNNL